MRFENSKYFKELPHEAIKLSFGTFYLCKRFFIVELNEGIHFDWKKIKEIMTKVTEVYGEDNKFAFISNRVNSHSIDPQIWQKLYKFYDNVVASAIVYYNNETFMNATIEKSFSNRSIKRCLSIDEAIIWISGLKEFN